MTCTMDKTGVLEVQPGYILDFLMSRTTSVPKYMTPLTFVIRLTIRLFYNSFCKSVNQQVKSKVHRIIDIMVYILL
jgi:hypothetical protein